MLFLSALYLLTASLVLMAALKKEHEVKFKHWLRAMGAFIVVRTLTLVFSSVANDLYFGYHQAMLIIWLLLTIGNVFAFLIVVSNFQELSNITRLEDMAKLKMSTISSLNASRSLSRNSLDSYKVYGTLGGVNSQPSPNVSVHGGPSASRPGSTTGSIASFNMNGPQPSPRVGQNPSASVPLSSFGLNFNPNGIFTTQQVLGTSQQSLGPQSMGRNSTPSTAPI